MPFQIPVPPKLLILVLTSLFLDGAQSHVLFPLIIIPILNQYTASCTEPQVFAMLAGLLGTTSFITSLPSSIGLSSSMSEVVALQSIFSAARGTATVAPLLLRRMLEQSEGEVAIWEAAMTSGLLWAGTWDLWERLMPLGRLGTSTPSPAAIPYLAPLLRLLGPTGLNLLQGVTGHLLWELTEPWGLNVDALLPRHWQSGTIEEIYDDENSEAPETPQRQPTTGTFATRTPDLMASGASTQLLSSTGSHFPGSRASRLPPSTMGSLGGGVETPGLSNMTASIDTRSTGPSKASTASNRPNTRKRRPWGTASKAFTAAVAMMWAAPLLKSASTPLSLSSPLTAITPIAIGCVLSVATNDTPLNDLIHSAQTVGNAARLLVTPESALLLHGGPQERKFAIGELWHRVAAQYGVDMFVGMDSYEFDDRGQKLWRNEVVWIGPEGEKGYYEKQKLVPFHESYMYNPGQHPAPTWTIDVSPPPGIHKFDWAHDPPHVRPLNITPLICLDIFHPQLVPNFHPLPDILVVPASAPSASIATQLVSQVQSLSMTHGVSSFLCSSARDGGGFGTSALIDGSGTILYQQKGGESLYVRTAVKWFGQYEDRPRTGWEVLGSSGVLGLASVCPGYPKAAGTSRGRGCSNGEVALDACLVLL